MNINTINAAAILVKDGLRIVGRATGYGVTYTVELVRNGRAVCECTDTRDYDAALAYVSHN